MFWSQNSLVFLGYSYLLYSKTFHGCQNKIFYSIYRSTQLPSYLLSHTDFADWHQKQNLTSCEILEFKDIGWYKNRNNNSIPFRKIMHAIDAQRKARELLAKTWKEKTRKLVYMNKCIIVILPHLRNSNKKLYRILVIMKLIGLMSRVFANGLRVIPKTRKIVLDAALLKTQHFKVRIKGKVKQSRECSRTLSYTLV